MTRGAIGSAEGLASSPPRPRVVSVVPQAGIASAARLAAVNEIGDPDARRVLTELMGRHASLAAPAVPYELRPPTHSVSGDVELGWAKHKVAAYFDHESVAADALRSTGWTVFAIERGLSMDALEKALGLQEKS